MKPVGMILDKVMAAINYKLKRVYIPIDNMPITQDLKGRIEVVGVRTLEDLFSHVFDDYAGGLNMLDLDDGCHLGTSFLWMLTDHDGEWMMVKRPVITALIPGSGRLTVVRQQVGTV